MTRVGWGAALILRIINLFPTPQKKKREAAVPLFASLFRPNVDALFARKDVNGLLRALTYQADSADTEAAAIRLSAAQALGNLGDPRAVDALLPLLRSPELKMSQTAAAGLGKIGDPRAVPFLVAALRSSSSVLRKAAAEALTALHWKPEGEDRGWYWLALQDWKQCARLGAAAYDPLYAALWDVDQNVRLEVVPCFGRACGARAVEPLARLAAGGEENLLKVAANIGVDSYDPMVRAIIFEKLKESEPGWRIAAVEALGLTGSRKAGDVLLQLLADPEYNICLAAVKSLGSLNEPRAVQPLFQVLSSNSTNSLYHAAAHALGEIRHPDALDAFIEASRSADPHIRRHACPALAGIGGEKALQALIPLANDADQSVRYTALEALAQEGGAQAVEPLLAALRNFYDNERKWARTGLIRIGDRSILPRVAPLLKDDHLAVRWDACKVLQALNWQPDEDLLAWYLAAQGDWAGCLALGAAAVEPFSDHLSKQHSLKMMEALKAGGSPFALQILSLHRDNPEPLFRWEVRDTIRHLENLPCPGGHNWDGCVCRVCGETRDEQHPVAGWKMVDDDYCACPRCGRPKEHAMEVFRTRRDGIDKQCERCPYTTSTYNQDW